MQISRLKWLLMPLAAIVFTAGIIVARQTRRVDENALKNADKGTEWVTYGHTYSEQRYSPLKQIDTTNVSRLGLAWSYEVGPGGGPQEATPLFANGVLYGITNWSITFAVDARTGKEIWRYDPQVVPGSVRLCCGVISRGIALYEGKVIVPVVDGRLVALDAATGKVLWSVVTVPKENSQNYSLTMAPRVMKGKVLIGNAGAEFAPYRGYLAAFDVNNGKELWRFYTVPGDPSKPFENKAMEAAAKTWAGEWWKYGGGGSMWDGMAYDPDAELVYVGTGNGLPWPQEIRQGKGSQRLDNLYITSILAIDVNSGRLKWHYQCTPGDEWDYDAIQHLMLADIRINGRNRKVIMQVNKNGYFYVLDRITGEFISGEPVAPVSWATGLDPKTGRPKINPDAYYSSERGVTVAPLQAHNTAQMAFNPATGLVYVPIAAAGTFSFTATANFQIVPGVQTLGLRGPGEPRPGAPHVRSSGLRTGTARTTRHPVRMGSGNAERAMVCACRRPERRRRALDGRQPCVPGHASRKADGIYRGQGRKASRHRDGTNRRHGAADDLPSGRQAIHRLDGRDRRPSRTRRGCAPIRARARRTYRGSGSGTGRSSTRPQSATGGRGCMCTRSTRHTDGNRIAGAAE